MGSPIIPADQLPPIIAHSRGEVEYAEKERQEALDRKKRLYAFWLGVMDADEKLSTNSDKYGVPIAPGFNERIRASELVAKADGLFVDYSRTDINMTSTYQEMITTRAGKMVELVQTTQSSLENADAVYEIELDAEEYDLAGDEDDFE